MAAADWETLPLADDHLLGVTLLSIPEVADLWCLSRASVYRLINRGELRVVYVGSLARVPATELSRWIGRHLDHPPLAAPTAIRRRSRSA